MISGVDIGTVGGGLANGAVAGNAADVSAIAEEGALRGSDVGVSDDFMVLSCSTMFC